MRSICERILERSRGVRLRVFAVPHRQFRFKATCHASRFFMDKVKSEALYSSLSALVPKVHSRQRGLYSFLFSNQIRTEARKKATALYFSRLVGFRSRRLHTADLRSLTVRAAGETQVRPQLEDQAGFGAGTTRPYRFMTARSAVLSGGPPELTTSATSRKYCAPMSGVLNISTRANSPCGLLNA